MAWLSKVERGEWLYEIYKLRQLFRGNRFKPLKDINILIGVRTVFRSYNIC